MLGTKGRVKRKKASVTETSDSSSREPELLPLLSNQLSNTACGALKVARTTLTHASHSISTRAHQVLSHLDYGKVALSSNVYLIG